MNAQFPLPGQSGGPRGYMVLPTDGLVVHVVDDDEAVRRSLALLLTSFGLTAETYDSAESLLADLHNLAAGCLVVDVRMPGMDGLLVVTGHADVGLAVKAMKAGAHDFIEKPYSDADLLASVRSALARVADTRHSGMVVEAARARIAILTPRERDVLMRLVEGRPNKVIAHELGISPRTVEIHRANMMEKLACRSLAEAVRLAIAAEFHKA